MNLVESVIDEIALEGLDGITLEALWSRLALRFGEKAPLSPHFMEQIWNVCLQIRELSFYELQTPRDKLIIFDRYEFVDPDFGLILEPSNVPDDIYTHCPIDDRATGLRGSCSSYYTRKEICRDIVKNLNVREAEETYGRKLIIVASQVSRQTALMDKTVCPTLDLTAMQYCFLERVGRSRYQGEITQGKLSLGLLNEDPKSLFYHRKFLLRHKLITKQMHHQKSGGHSCTGSLLHLPRFYVERKPKVMFLAEKVIEMLKTRDNNVAEYSEIKKELSVENSIKKLFKTSFFQKFVRTDLLVPYRTLYPNAKSIEWQRKNNPSKEKILRVVQLVDPNIDINDMWNKDEILDEDDPFELDLSTQKLNVSFLRQANAIVEAERHKGLGQSELGRKMGLPKLQSRSIFRNLVKRNVVATYMNDMGRQRVTKYVSRRYENNSTMSKQFKHEMYKMQRLAETTLLAKKWEDTEEKTVLYDGETAEPSSSPRIVEANGQSDDDESAAINGVAHSPKVQTNYYQNFHENTTRSFDAATRILRKYKLTAFSGSYKRTYKNVAEMRDEWLDAANEKKRRRLTRYEDENEVTEASAGPETPREMSSAIEVEKKKLVDRPIAKVASQKSRHLSTVGLMSDIKNPDIKNVSNVTYRLLKRANIIIEAVKEHKVIDDMTKLMKVISDEEGKEGYDVRIDKKSLIRLLQRLAKDNLVKNIKLTLSANGKEKSLTFVCDPSIDVNHTVIRSAVEQAKIKFCLIEAQKVKTILQSNTEKLELTTESANELGNTDKCDDKSKNESSTVSTPINLIYDTKAGRRYGYSPKFIRMQTLHAFLFYIIYEHPGEMRDTQEKMIESLREKGFAIDENLEKDMSPIFSGNVDWKMFVPPLPKHNGWPTGWALMCDILLRLPLSVFLKVHKVSFVIPELDEYTSHPIRKHSLVKDLPAPIRNVLLKRRKYIFSVHDAITRLCYIGLVQFGAQKLKEKDKVFFYLNRNTELLDTTSSAAHYHKIEAKEYPLIKFNLTSCESVEKYWYKLWTICINTHLGGRLVVQGKDIVLEDLSKKNEMIEATRARKPEEASIMDIGHVPGDRMGAAGIDSAFFAHLKRNWNWDSSNFPFHKAVGCFGREDASEGERQTYMSRVKPKPLKFTEFHGLKIVTGPVTVDAVDLKKTTKKPIEKRSNITNVSSGSSKKMTKQQQSSRVTINKIGGCARSGKQRSYVRRVLPRRSRIRPRVKYDDIDYSALQKMDKLRVDWDTREDNILLVCKVAMKYLCPNPRRQIITFTAVRDVLRSYSVSSCNKTSRACQRRLHYMLKKPQTLNSVTLGVEELKQNFYVNRRFGDIVDKLKKEYRNPYKYDEQVTLVFRDLVTYIAKKHYDISEMQSSTRSFGPSTVDEFNLLHRVKYPSKASSVEGFHDETTNDVHSATINSVIHSSMCSGKDRRSWAYQLFRIYQQYPEWLLRSAMAKIRADQMVSVKKNYVFAMRKHANACMPMSSSQYQLSSGYIQKFNTKIPFSVFKESYEFFVKLVGHYQKFSDRKKCDTSDTDVDDEDDDDDDDGGVQTTPITGGIVVAVHDYINVNRLNFDLEIPEHIIMLDPTLERDDERYVRIARRYHDILRNLEHFNTNILDYPENSKENRQRDGATAISSITEGPSSTAIGNTDSIDKSNDDSLITLKDLGAIESCAKTGTESNSLPSDTILRQIFDTTKASNSTSAPQVNTDTEAFESDHDVNFEPEGDDDDNDDMFYENDFQLDADEDDQICFLDGTKIHLTSEDIERSGLKLSVADLARDSSPDHALTIALPEKIGENDCNVDRTDGNIENSTQTVRDDASDKETRILGSNRVNEIIKKAKCLRDGQGPYYRTADANDRSKRYTRIALLKMREELNDLTPNDSHHAHEYFVLNMFNIFYALDRKIVKNPTDRTTFNGISLPTELMPLNRDIYNRLIEDLKKFAILPKSNVSYQNFKREHFRNCKIFNRGLDAVYEFIEEKREVGASMAELATRFYSILGDSLYEILSVLKEHRLVLRSGVKNTRYIHQDHADPWLIHSYKIMRLQKESMQNVPMESVYVMSNSAKSASKTASETETSAVTNATEQVEEKNSKKTNVSTENDGESGASSERKLKKSRTCLLQTKDIYRAAKQLDLDTAEEIRVVVRPWICVDGTLNRRVLDRMLGAVLAYCLRNPGAYLRKVQEKFAPALQPFHTKELVEMLVTMECLQIGAAQKMTVTLFSKSSSAKPQFSGAKRFVEFEDEEIVIEPRLDATLKFSIFLSNRTYASDFLA